MVIRSSSGALSPYLLRDDNTHQNATSHHAPRPTPDVPLYRANSMRERPARPDPQRCAGAQKLDGDLFHRCNGSAWTVRRVPIRAPVYIVQGVSRKVTLFSLLCGFVDRHLSPQLIPPSCTALAIVVARLGIDSRCAKLRWLGLLLRRSDCRQPGRL